MATINPNILLAGITPDLGENVAKGMAIGRSIREAPMRERLLNLNIAQQQSAQNAAQLEQALQQANVVSGAVGDIGIDQMQDPETYNNVVGSLKSVNFPVQPENDPESPQFAGYGQAGQNLFKASGLANRLRIQAGIGKKRVQSSVDVGGGLFRIIYNDGTAENKIPTPEERSQIRSAQEREIEFLANKREAEAKGTVTGREGGEQDIAGDKQDRLAAEKSAIQRAIADVRIESDPDIAAAVELAKTEARSRGEDVNLLADMEASLPAMQDFISELKELNKSATATMPGRAFDAVAGAFGFSPKGATAKEKYRSIVSNEVLPLLKQTFGSAFTEKEGERLMATLGDINKPVAEREAALDAFIESKQRQILTLQRKETSRQEKPAVNKSDRLKQLREKRQGRK